MSTSAEDYSEGEVLTGAELYLYLLRQNEEQLERAQSKLDGYSTLKDTLTVLTERSRRRVLAPVAGGLAYLPAELNATNTILVLLGDKWFVERSAVQASEIAGRRVDFLRREVEVLRQEHATLQAKQDLFISELPEAHDAVEQLLAERDARHDALVKQPADHSVAPCAPLASTTQTLPPCAVSAPTQSAAGAAGIAVPTEDAKPACSAPSPASLPTDTPAASSSLGEGEFDYASVDAALATFDELDELTEDELIALEHELGDRLDDDEYVERVMTERMIAKKEKRVRAELGRRQATVAATANTNQPSTLAAVAAVPALQKETPPAVPQVPGTFRSPGDIGSGMPSVSNAAATPSVTVNVTEQRFSSVPPAAVSVSPSTVVGDTTAGATAPNARVETPQPIAPTGATSAPRKAKHVCFADDVFEKTETTVAASSADGNTPSGSSPFLATAATDRDEKDVEPARPLPSLLRSTYRIGDIVEHTDTTSAVQPAPPPPMQRTKPKRKSLFMRDLEGNDDL